MSNSKSIALTVLELFTFNGQKFRGSRDPGHAPFCESSKGVMYGLSLEVCTSNLKPVALTVLELFAFNGQKFRGSRDPGHAQFGKILRGSCTDCTCKHAREI